MQQTAPTVTNVLCRTANTRCLHFLTANIKRFINLSDLSVTEIMQGLTVAISGAKKYFYMQTPYFLPTEQILGAMQTAALAGVDIRLMLPEHADNRVTHLGSCSYLADVLRAGVKVYFYKKGFLHSKLMVSDDMLSTVGSTISISVVLNIILK